MARRVARGTAVTAPAPDSHRGGAAAPPWAVVVTAGFTLAAGGMLHPWALGQASWSVAVSVEAAGSPWWLASLALAATLIAVSVLVNGWRQITLRRLAAVAGIPAVGVAGAASITAEPGAGPGAVLAFGGASLVVLAAAASPDDGPSRMDRSGGGTLAAVLLLLVAVALPWSTPDGATGAYAAAADAGGLFVWAIVLLGAAALAATTFAARTVTSHGLGLIAALATFPTVWVMTSVEHVDRTSPAALLALVAGAALAIAALDALMRVAEAPTPEPPNGGVVPAEPSGHRWIASIAAVLGGLALHAVAAPWVLGPTFTARDALVLAPAGWGGDVIGAMPVLVLLVGAPVVVVAAGWLGARAIAVGATVIGAAVVAVAAVPVAAGGPFTATATVAAVLGALAAGLGVVATVVAARSGPRGVGPAVAAVVPALMLVFAGVPDPSPRTDGPFEVLHGGGSPARVGVLASTTAALGERSLGDSLGRHPVLLDGAPGLVTTSGSYLLSGGRPLPLRAGAGVAGLIAQHDHRVVIHGPEGGPIGLWDPVTEERTALNHVFGLAASPGGRVLIRSAADDEAAGRWYESDRAGLDRWSTGEEVDLTSEREWSLAPIVNGAVDDVVLATDGATYVNRLGAVGRVEPDGRRTPVVGGRCDPSHLVAGPGVAESRPRHGRVVADDGGGLWFTRPAPEERSSWLHAQLLFRADPDGTVEVVDHPVRHVEAMTAVDGDLLILEGGGRLLRLSDAVAALSPLPPPECDEPDEPQVVGEAFARRLLLEDSSLSRTVPVSTAGTVVGLDPVDGRRIMRGGPDGTWTTASEVPEDRMLAGSLVVRPDGSVRWLERPVGSSDGDGWVLRGLDAAGDLLPDIEVQVPADVVADDVVTFDAADDEVVVTTRREVIRLGAGGASGRPAEVEIDVTAVLGDDGRVHVVLDGVLHEVVDGEVVRVGFAEGHGVDRPHTLAAAIGDGAGVDELPVPATAITPAEDGGLVVATSLGFVHLDAERRPTLLLDPDTELPRGRTPVPEEVGTARRLGTGRAEPAWYVVDGHVVVRNGDVLGFEVVVALP